VKIFKTKPTGTRGKDQAQRHEIEQIVRREGDELARLTHPNLVRYFDHRPYDGTWYVVEEYVKGKDLEKLMASTELKPESIRYVFNGMMSGVNYLHTQGKIVRDIKLDNVLISEDLSNVKITDLQFIGDLSMIMAVKSPTWGSLRYAAPELVQNQATSATFQSDIYALGVCLYYMLKKETESIGGLNVLKGDDYDQKLRGLLGNIDPKYQGFLRVSLDKDPSRRFNSVAKMSEVFNN